VHDLRKDPVRVLSPDERCRTKCRRGEDAEAAGRRDERTRLRRRATELPRSSRLQRLSLVTKDIAEDAEDRRRRRGSRPARRAGRARASRRLSCRSRQACSALHLSRKTSPRTPRNRSKAPREQASAASGSHPRFAGADRSRDLNTNRTRFRPARIQISRSVRPGRRRRPARPAPPPLPSPSSFRVRSALPRLPRCRRGTRRATE
jgi:hypothetical protein